LRSRKTRLCTLALVAITVALCAVLPAGSAVVSSLASTQSRQPDPNPAPNPSPPQAADIVAEQHQEELAATTAQHAAQIAAIREANRAASAARRAEHIATAEQAAQAEWQRTGMPAHLILVRPRVVDVITDGHLTSRFRRSGGALSLSTLGAYLPSGWLSTSGDTAVLSAALGLTAGTSLDPGVTTLRLSGGADAASAASIWVGRGTLNLHNLSVTSWDSGSQQPMPASAAGRPFITVGSGGRLDATDATLNNLGAIMGPAGGHDHTGVAFGPGSTGTLLRTRLAHNGVGLKLSRSENVRLQGVTVEHSDGDGLVLHDDHGTALQAVDVNNNARNGVLVTGAVAGRVLSGVTAFANGAFGAAAIRQRDLQVIGISTFENRSGGLRLTGCLACRVAGTSAAREPVGLLVNGSASQITVENARVQGAPEGVLISHGVTGVDIGGLYVDQAGLVGVAVAAAGVRLREIAVSNSATAVNVTGAAAKVTLSSVMISGGRDGIVVASGARDVTLRNAVTHDLSHNAVVVSSPGVVIAGGSLDGGTTGINARAPTSIDGTSVSRVREGVHVARGVTVHGIRMDVVATRSGIKVDPDGEFVMTDSRVQAPDALRGRVVARGKNIISAPPFPWLGAVGVMLVAVAVLLELLRTILQRRTVLTGIPTFRVAHAGVGEPALEGSPMGGSALKGLGRRRLRRAVGRGARAIFGTGGGDG
jgi:hypothetical protein